jgi:HD superfamily phosphohydrolase
MAQSLRKIINDPVHGFITIDDPLVFQVIAHPYFQRLRRIHQMAFAHLVYPGAVHSRLHHALGAYHLMTLALQELKSKGTAITPEEETAAKIAILLHDIGHGPYSHALERVLIRDVEHEAISNLIMKVLDFEFGGKLQMAIDIFTGQYPKPFLHQLVSGQLDVDRMDYLSRDSFFTGVAEGVIGYDRIIKMLQVVEGSLLIEEKGIFSTEKFLVSRRLMYWQVYLHKTVLCAEKMLVRIIERVRYLLNRGVEASSGSALLDLFLLQQDTFPIESHLDEFCRLDDYDVLTAIKHWTEHPDYILRYLSRGLLDRKLLKVKMQADPIDESWANAMEKKICSAHPVLADECRYFLIRGEVINTTYDPIEERIQVLFKDGSIKDISQVDNALIRQSLAGPMKKHYICYPDD